MLTRTSHEARTFAAEPFVHCSRIEAMIPCDQIPIVHWLAAILLYLCREWKLLIIAWTVMMWLGPSV